VAKISFVIPVYNVEKYLERCLDSLISQTDADFEAILVDDDGSSDNSGTICSEYARADSRFIHHRHKNTWASASRNAGLDLVKTGEYVTFIDSDDYIEPDYIEKLYPRAIDCRADVLSFGYKKNEANDIISEAPPDMIVKPNSNTILEHFCRDWLHMPRQNYVWSRLYRREFLDSAGGRFSPNLRVAEDRNFLYRILHKSKCTAYASETPYFYFQHSQSVCRSSISASTVFFKGYLDSYKDILDFWSEEGFKTFDCIKPIILFHALRAVIFHLKRSAGDLEQMAEIAVQSLEGFPIEDEFEPNKLRDALKIYSDICGLSWVEQSQIWLFALSLTGGREGIKLYQEIFDPYLSTISELEQ
jgi:glycosyltransferase involved in cell wall biosynthesis